MGSKVFTRGPCGPHAKRQHKKYPRQSVQPANTPKGVATTRRGWHFVHRHFTRLFRDYRDTRDDLGDFGLQFIRSAERSSHDTGTGT